MSDDELRARVKAALTSVAAPSPDVGVVSRKARRLRRRRAMTASVAAVVVAIGIIVPLAALVPTDESDHPTPLTPRVTGGRQAMSDFPPATMIAGSRTMLSVTFPDGSTANVTYPSELELGHHGVGIAPNITASVEGTSCGVDLIASRESLEGEYYDGPAALAQYDGPAGTVELWRGTGGNASYYLVYRFQDWWLLSPCRVGPSEGSAELALWAASLSGHQSPDGFLVVEGIPPLVVFSDGPPELYLGGDGIFVQLSVGTCTTSRFDRDASDGVIDICYGREVNMYALADGRDVRNLSKLSEQFEVRRVEPIGEST
jgi:hypothetical protein